MESEFGFAPLATQRAVLAGQETGAVTALIYSFKANAAIKNISDLRGKRIGVGRVLVADAYPLQFQVSNLRRGRDQNIVGEGGSMPSFPKPPRAPLNAVA